MSRGVRYYRSVMNCSLAALKTGCICKPFGPREVIARARTVRFKPHEFALSRERPLTPIVRTIDGYKFVRG